MTNSISYRTAVVCQYCALAIALGFPAAAMSAKARDGYRQGAAMQSFSRAALEQMDRLRTRDSTIRLQDLYVADPVEPDLCAELRDVAISAGHQPPVCGDGPDGSATTAPTSGSDDAPPANGNDTTTQPEQEDVLLVHGFSISAAFSFAPDHDCLGYWGAQKQEIENSGRKAWLVGYYDGNEGCEVNLPDDNPPDPSPNPLEIGDVFGARTPLIEVAHELKRWIFDNYSSRGESIDIVAHSLGGIVVRLMLEQWGQQLLVSDVVTLGTPHAGVSSAVLIPCPAIGQCIEVAMGSEFINNLTHNPQSAIDTQWTLIAAANDQVVGNATALGMNSGNGPTTVSTFEYDFHHKHGCSRVFGAFSAIGHQDLQGDAASLPVHECNIFGFSTGTVPTPTERIMNALN